MKINEKLDRESLIKIRNYIHKLKKGVSYMREVDRVRKLILKWKINRALLADKVGMPKTTFSYIIKGKPHYKISPAQLEKLKKILISMSNEFKTIR